MVKVIHLKLIIGQLLFACMNLCVGVYHSERIMKNLWMFIYLLLMSKYYIFFIYY